MCYLYEHYFFLGLMIITSVTTIMLQWNTNRCVKKIQQDCKRLPNVKSAWIRRMIVKFETSYKLHMPIYDVSSFLDKYLAGQGVLGQGLALWSDVGLLGAWVQCVLIGLTTLAAIQSHSDVWGYLLHSIYGLLMLGIIIGMELIMRTNEIERQIRTELLDYLDNHLRPRLENQYLFPSKYKEYQQNYFEKPKKIEALPEPAATVDREELLQEIIDEVF